MTASQGRSSLFFWGDSDGCAREDIRVRTLEGQLLAKWRGVLGLTQEELGEACGRSAKQVSNIEVGPSSASVATLLNVIRGLGLPGRDDAQLLERFFAGPERDLGPREGQ